MALAKPDMLITHLAIGDMFFLITVIVILNTLWEKKCSIKKTVTLDVD